MKLVRAISLRSVQGTTTAVFEIDLCEVGPDRWVVNFRYGKLGQRLAEGSKTPLPVGKDEAERIIAKLVSEKKKKGYVDAAAPSGGLLGAPTVSSAPPRRIDVTPTQVDDDPRAATLLRYLGDPRAASFPLRNVIWRVGELRLSKAAPALRNLLMSGDRSLQDKRGMPPWRYAVVWALARCHDPANLPVFATVRADSTAPDSVRRVATVGLRDHLSGADADAFVAELAGQLPATIAQARDEGLDALRVALARHLADGAPERHDVLFALYVMGGEVERAALVEQLQTIALRHPGFRTVRHILKAAELRGDGEIFGLLARRFELTRATPVEFWRPRDAGYLTGTRKYLRRRVWRTLRRRGSDGSDEYVDLAVGVLLAFTDDDAQGTPGNDGALARYWPLGHILFGAHPAAHVSQRSLSMSLGRSYSATDGRRGELFPALWDRQPMATVALMLRSQCAPVHRFAARVFRQHPDAWSSIEREPLLALLDRPYDETVALAAEIAIARYDASKPDLPLVLALAQCRIDAARKTAHTWIAARPGAFFTDAVFASTLLLSVHDDARRFARNTLATTLLVPTVSRAIVARVLSELLATDRDEALTEEIGRDLEQALTQTFASVARTLSLDVIGDLLGHPSAAVQRLGVALLDAHDTRPEALPPELLATPMVSAHADVRAAGVRLFGKLPDRILATRVAVLADLCINPHQEVRDAVGPIVGRLARFDADFARALTLALVDALAQPEPQEGLHAQTVALIRAQLAPALSGLSLEPIWKLLHAPDAATQELGGTLLENNVPADQLEIWRVAKLGSHDVLAVRQAAWRIYRESLPGLKAKASEALTILDATWEDTRQFAFDFFGQHFGSEDFSPTLLVGICDSVRPDVQQFGRKLVTRFFVEDDGPAYLTRLSQHPTADMQRFATNYLEQFASGSPDRIESLSRYFATVLCGVNKGRVAKKRVLSFLRREALADLRVATMVAELLTELSLTIAVEYRAAAIEILDAIRRTHPSVPTPLRVVEPERRSPRAV